VIGEWDLAASARRNAWRDAPGFELFAQPGAVLAAIGDQVIGLR
jgi:hypothetical protein